MASLAGWLLWRRHGGSWQRTGPSVWCHRLALLGGSPRAPQDWALALWAALAWAWLACSRCVRQQRRQRWPMTQAARLGRRARPAAAGAARASSRWGRWAMRRPWPLWPVRSAEAATTAALRAAAREASMRHHESWRHGRPACGASNSASNWRPSGSSVGWQVALERAPVLVAVLPAAARRHLSLRQIAAAGWLLQQSGGRQQRRRARCCRSRMQTCSRSSGAPPAAAAPPAPDSVCCSGKFAAALQAWLTITEHVLERVWGFLQHLPHPPLLTLPCTQG